MFKFITFSEEKILEIDQENRSVYVYIYQSVPRLGVYFYKFILKYDCTEIGP